MGAKKPERDDGIRKVARPSFARPYYSHQGHLLLHADCLSVLAAASAKAPFDLIYVDPPFNAGGKRRARNVKGPRVEGPAAYRDAWGGLDAFLGMLKPRLAAMRDALSDVGSLWVHLDYRAVHDTKTCLDELFGRPAFQGEIVWLPGNGAKRQSGPSVTHQTILIYSRSKTMIWNADSAELREPFAATSQRMHFQRTDADGRHYREREINGKIYRYYADIGRRRGSVWDDCPAMNANTPLTGETTGYPTQKPERLLRRIVCAASNEGSRVLDPMCGSGTTLAVAASLGRRVVGVDESDLACAIAKRRLEAVLNPSDRP